ncbi:MAG: outer membrane beta-barrel protein [Pseudomonadota bacterium]
MRAHVIRAESGVAQVGPRGFRALNMVMCLFRRCFVNGLTLVLTAALPVLAGGPANAQSTDESGLRGSTPVIAPRTLTERRLQRQGGASESASTARSGLSPPALPDPFDEFSAPSPGEPPVDRSDVFRDLREAAPVPRPRRAAGQQEADLQTGGERTRAIAAPEPGVGPLDGRTLAPEDLPAEGRPGTDQARSFPGREQATDLFEEQEDPFEALGLRLGRFDIFPSVTVTGGYTDNTSGSSGGDGGSFYRIRPELTATSDWSRHQVDVTFRGDFQGFPDRSDDNEPSAELDVDGRLDVGRATTVDLGLTYSLAREDQSSANVAAGDEDGILDQTLGASVRVNRDAGLIGVGIGGSVTRDFFTGGTTETEDRSNTEILGTLRLSLASDAVIRPFVEGSGGRRTFDGDRDTLGFDRDSTVMELRGGAELDIAPKLTGEASVGYRREDVSDSALEDLEGIVFDASLIWSPDRLTLLTLTGATDFDPTTIAGATGSITYSASAGLTRSLRKNLTLDATLGLSYERFEGFPREDLRTNAGLGLTFDLNRHAAITAEYSYDRLDSTDSSADFDANTFELGVRLQH